ncbi:hypothetical protein DNI29_14195 [Hymenobacter sediminis]|uniref:hypothetical protein n=1 Tax=Hymenobacter sediminis TaxID=2218621 RepID=UPI000DA647AF|nr:hypothetical protein [Hymenobacter sediminis]RPD46154.1 hypothetical protein DNI29_14195 [Hymenobacter sediminis]
MNKRFLTSLLIVFVLLDTALTFWQSRQLPLDGDLVVIVFPAPWYTQVLQDPFGWAVLTKNAVYAGTNRFFAHAAMGVYWKQVPRLLQYVTTPIESLYLASALFNTLVQLLVLFALAAYVWLGGGRHQGRWGFWVAAALLTPLFQIDGFYQQMGVTNAAITYTFFYAFPCGLLLLLLWPFFRAAREGRPFQLPLVRLVLLALLMVVIAFNGPIATAAVAVLLLGIGLYWAWQQWRRVIVKPAESQVRRSNWLSGQALVLLALLAGLSMYSLYIGRNNSENSHIHTLGELYKLLPTGVYLELKHAWGLPLLLGLILLNAQLIRRLLPVSVEREWSLRSLQFVGLFAVVFIVLLPFGGYRDYRPYLVRGDSILPVILGMMYAYGVSTYVLLFQLRNRARNVYAVVVALFLAVFVYADATPKLTYNNDCERWTLDQLARAPETEVRISPLCNLLSWGTITDPGQSELQGQMLQYWGITSRPKRYYQ